jgi:mannose-6-phosphate isomerase-like protein (cupin superfamily)
MQHVEPHSIQAFDFFGIAIHDLTAAVGAKSASVARIGVPPGASHERARSRKCDKYYVGLSGRLRFFVGGRAIDLEPQALLLIEQGEWFEYANQENEAAEVLLIHVPPFDLEAEEFAGPDERP